MLDGFDSVLHAGHVVGPEGMIEILVHAVALITSHIIEDDGLQFHDRGEWPEEVRSAV